VVRYDEHDGDSPLPASAPSSEPSGGLWAGGDDARSEALSRARARDGQPANVPVDRLLAVAAGGDVEPEVHAAVRAEIPVLEIDRFNLWYGPKQALHRITMPVPHGRVTALVGPSGCGKSTLLRSVNRLNDLVPNVRITGDMRLSGDSIYDPRMDVIELRKRMGMVFQKPNPFPMSIYENVVYSLRIDGEHRRSVPEVLLLDEPCSALDPVATSKVEDLIQELRGRYSVLIVTHNMQQASRTSDYTAFMYLGRLIEYGPTTEIFTKPVLKETEAYVTGRFG
jgi:phosphate transport system ATP-binding protein